MSDPWALVTSDDADPVLASIALVHEQLNPLLLADGYMQDQADQTLARVTRDLCTAVKRASPSERGDTARRFALRCIREYSSDGHKTH
jgi:hypothetical protein